MSLRLRSFALLGAAALGVHQLRYALAYGAEADDAAAAQGHGYVEVGGAIVGILLVAAFAQLLSAVARRRRPSGRTGTWLRLWGTATSVLIFVYGAQELTEGMLSPGHPGGLAGVIGQGGWVAVPLALALGALVAALLRGAEAILTRFAVSRRAPRERAPRATLPRAPLAVLARPVAALAGPGAGRAPPLLGR